MMNAPTSSAITGCTGRPNVSSGMKEVCAAALFADSGEATPSMAPRPKFSGCFDTRFSTEYDVNAARTCPPPGSTPSADPIAVPRSTGIRIRRKSSRLSHSPCTFVLTTLWV